MWNKIVQWIIRNRLRYLWVLGIVTVFMAVMIPRLRLSYGFGQAYSGNITEINGFEHFLEDFKVDESTVFAGFSDDKLFVIENFKAFENLIYNLERLDGVKSVSSFISAVQVDKDEEKSEFDIQPIFNNPINNQQELDSLLTAFFAWPLYDGLFYNSDHNAILMRIVLNEPQNPKAMGQTINTIEHLFSEFHIYTDIHTYLSGLSFIQHKASQKLKTDLFWMVMLSFCVAFLVLFTFSRSLKIVFFGLSTLLIGVIWVLGICALFNLELGIWLLTGVPLILILGTQNILSFFNTYYSDYRKHAQKTLALSRSIRHLCKKAFLLNILCVFVFVALLFAGNKILIEIAVAGITAIVLWSVLALLLLPQFCINQAFLRLNPERMTNLWLERFLAGVEKIVASRKIVVLITSIVILGFSVWGVCLLKISGRVIDDIPQKSTLYEDLKFFDENLGGILPLHILIDTKREREAVRYTTLSKINTLQEELENYSQLSASLSFVDILKMGKQAYYDGDRRSFDFPSSSELNMIMTYTPVVEGMDADTVLQNISRYFFDKDYRQTQLSLRVKNLDVSAIESLKSELETVSDNIFEKDRFDIEVLSVGLPFSKGMQKMDRRFWISGAVYLGLMLVLLYALFGFTNLLWIPVIPALLTALLTGAMMGFIGLHLKSAYLSLFLWITSFSVYIAIRFLQHYRLELRMNDNKPKPSVLYTIGVCGGQMLYVSLALFWGLIILLIANFESVQAFGGWLSLAVIIALFMNLLVLPALLILLEKDQKNITQNRYYERITAWFRRPRKRIRLENRTESETD